MNGILRALGWILAGVLLTAIAGSAFYLNTRPSLSVWHSVHPSEEFTAGSAVDSFPEYLELEARLFQQLEAFLAEEATTFATVM